MSVERNQDVSERKPANVASHLESREVARYRVAAEVIRLAVDGRSRVRRHVLENYILKSPHPYVLFGLIRVRGGLQIHFESGHARHVTNGKVLYIAVLGAAARVRVHSRLNTKRLVDVLAARRLYSVHDEVFYRAEIDGRIIPVVSVQRDEVVLGMSV